MHAFQFTRVEVIFFQTILYRLNLTTLDTIRGELIVQVSNHVIESKLEVDKEKQCQERGAIKSVILSDAQEEKYA